MRQNKKRRFVTRLGAILAVISQAVMFSPLAQAIHIPSPSEVASELEHRYNINLQSVQNQAQSFNVSDQKKLSPEVSLYFSPTDPRVGEKVQARAFPIYFNNPDDALYYTWYLKRKNCDLGGGNLDECDHDGSGTVTVNDWKIEAMRYVVQQGFVVQGNTYTRGDNDGDGYRASLGGDNKAGTTKDYCYLVDKSSGTAYELATTSGNSGFNCSAGYTAVCISTSTDIDPGTINPLIDQDNDTFIDSSTEFVSGFPVCSGTTAFCTRGVARCRENPVTGGGPDPGASYPLGCDSVSRDDLLCQHYFADPPGRVTGDGSFGLDEERFWQSDPNDPSTAQNSRKDEANAAGLGAQSFEWNYLSGDRVGVLVEGTSMIPTKHNDSSMMIMYALPRGICRPSNTGQYTETVKGYPVTIPITDKDINECIPDNLIDPTEGGQPISSGLEVSVMATPENPVNDETTDQAGDTVVAQATLDNSTRENSTILYDWSVHLTKNPATSATSANDVTNQFRELGLISNTSGNALDRIDVTLNIPNNRSTHIFTNSDVLEDYLTGGAGYLRFVVNVQEVVDGVVLRRGRSDVLIKFISTERKISAYTVSTQEVDGKMRVKTDMPICGSTSLERNSCRVIKNEIIGLKLDPKGLTNFNWTINGSPLVCSSEKVSLQCKSGSQNEVNFFPVTGNVGETYTVSVSATDAQTGRSVMLARTFHVVEPFVEIQSADEALLTPVFLGYYKDVLGTADRTACTDGLCPNYAKDAYTAIAGAIVTAEATYVPGYLKDKARSYWELNGVRAQTGDVPQATFQVSNIPGTIDRLEFVAMAQESNDIRKALFDIWKISPLDSPEYHFATAVNITVGTGESAQNQTGPRKYLALISSYVPATMLFTLRILLSGFVVLFVIGVLFNFYPERKRRSVIIG